jgi:uncharacterized protein involved in exopolysaccharide biosynthesis
VTRLRRLVNRQPSARVVDRFHRAEAALDATNLRLSALRRDYSDVRTQASSVGSVQVLNSAQSASSDRLSKLQILVFIGLVAGTAIGLTLAVLAAKRALRRSMHLPSL